MSTRRDHGGDLDRAIRRHGGHRRDWLDLSTGINPVPYPLPRLTRQDWTALPDHAAQAALVAAARAFWDVPEGADVLAAPGASALIAAVPRLADAGRVRIDMPTYNEHAAAFRAEGWSVIDASPSDARVLVHPNNPDGRLFDPADADAPMTVIDESFCDVLPARSMVALANRPGVVVLKSFGKFWGLAGLRLGFAIARPETVARLADMLGPWPVSGPALAIATKALKDADWAEATRDRLATDALRLDGLLQASGARVVGGTALFRLARVEDAAAWQARLARACIWTRIFPHDTRLVRVGLPAPDGWDRLAAAL